MNPVADLTAAWRGWAEIVAGRDSAAQNFTPGLPGLASAILWFLAAVLLSTAVQSMAFGMPGLWQVLFGLVSQGITIAALALAISQSLRFLKIDVPLLTLLVPTIYAMALTFVLAIPLTLTGTDAAVIAVIGLSLLIWQAGRVLAGMRNGTAIALAVLCFMVLVVVPNALYIVSQLFPSPA